MTGAEPHLAPETAATVTLLGPGTHFEGLLTFRGRARIEGELQGEIVGHGLLELGASAKAIARIEVDELVVAGQIEGNVRASQRVELLASGCIRGDVETPRLVIAEGGLLLGRCTTGASVRTPAGTPAPSLPRSSRARSS
jgi:cytoskeletal protein CcmA (bactofilin family)